MGVPWTRDDLARHYSPNWYRVYRAAKLPRARWDDADRAWRKQYATHRPKLIPGARRVLKQLRSRHQLGVVTSGRSEEHTSELQSHLNLVCRLLLEKKKNNTTLNHL